MHVRHVYAVIALAAAAATGAAHASTVYTVTASYDPDFNQNTSITIDNLTNSALTGVSILSGTSSEVQLDIAANGSETYWFSEQSGGPFQQEPGNAGVPDSTAYQVTATYNGQTIASNLFSPQTNATGQYIDFLGNCQVAQGCSLALNPDGSNFPAAGGVVALGNTPVPLPPSLALFASGLLGLAGRVYRRARA